MATIGPVPRQLAIRPYCRADVSFSFPCGVVAVAQVISPFSNML